MSRKHLTGLFRHKNYISWVIYGVAALLLMLLQTAPRVFPSIFGARPLPLIPFVVCAAILEGAKAGAVIGALSGLLWGVYAFRLFGFDALLLMLIGLTVGLLVEWFLRANLLSASVLCTGAVLLWTLADWLCFWVIPLREQPGAVLLRVLLPNALYTVLLSPLVYWMVLTLARFIRRRNRE